MKEPLKCGGEGEGGGWGKGEFAASIPDISVLKTYITINFLLFSRFKKSCMGRKLWL